MKTILKAPRPTEVCAPIGYLAAYATLGLLLLPVLGAVPVFAQSCGSTEALRGRDGSILEAAAKWDGVVVYARPSFRRKMVRRLAFAATFRVFAERADFYCLGEVDSGAPVGWVSREDVLTLKTALIDERTGCYRKVMVRNSATASSGEVGQFWNHPFVHLKPRRRIGLYEVRFVFDDITEPGGESVYLAGTLQQWNIDNADKVLDGWVSEDDVFSWNTRVGVQYRGDLEQPVYIFAKQEHIEDVYCYGKTQPWAFSSVGDTEWHYERERFPVLSETLGTGCLADHRILEVGAFGTVQLKDKELSAAEADALMSTINRLRGRSQSIDILFVIDGTESMQPAFVEVRRAVQMVKDQRTLVDARYALLMFKDFSTMWPPRMTKRLLKAEELSQELDRYMKEVRPDWGDPNFTEAVLDALQYGLDQMTDNHLWRDESTRAVILIGDHGDHREPNYQKRLADVLQTLDSQRVRFFAYQTRNTRRYRQQAAEAYHLFREDASALIDGMAVLFPRVEIAQSSAENIANALREMNDWRIRIDDGYHAIRHGDVPPSLVGPYIERMLLESGFQLRNVIAWGRAPQICAKGFVILEDQQGLELFEKRIRIGYEDIARLVVAFRDFFGDVTSVPRCLNAMKIAFQAATGDVPRDNESPSEFLQRTLGIKMKSDLLTRPFEELARVLVNNRTARDELRRRLQRSERLLDAVYREEQVIERPDGTVKSIYEGGRIKRQRWFKVMPDGSRVAWIPATYIP